VHFFNLVLSHSAMPQEAQQLSAASSELIMQHRVPFGWLWARNSFYALDADEPCRCVVCLGGFFAALWFPNFRASENIQEALQQLPRALGSRSTSIIPLFCSFLLSPSPSAFSLASAVHCSHYGVYVSLLKYRHKITKEQPS